jgi:hypothetical protein
MVEEDPAEAATRNITKISQHMGERISTRHNDLFSQGSCHLELGRLPKFLTKTGSIVGNGFVPLRG